LGQYFADNFDCQYDAFVSLEQPAAGVVNDFRMGGYREGFESICGPIENLREIDAGGVTDTARTVFTDVLTTLPGAERIVVVGINDDVLLGALAAARTSGREGNLYMSGQGGDPSAHCEIANNPNWVGDVAYFPERYGEIGIPYIIDMINGVDIPFDLLVPHQWLNADNIGDFYDVSGC
jgi:ribose transport system substrate-binding protein